MSQRDSDSTAAANRSLNVIATPEGDGELDPAEPLQPEQVDASVAGMQTPPGNAPSPYDGDSPSELSAVVDVIDKVSRGKIQP